MWISCVEQGHGGMIFTVLVHKKTADKGCISKHLERPQLYSLILCVCLSLELAPWLLIAVALICTWLWGWLSVSLLSFVQLGWLVCFFDQIFLHLQASVHFVCACHGGYRSLISVSHLEGLQSPASALLRACLSWGTSFQRPHWTQIKENISKFKSIPLISGLSLIWGTTFQNWKDKLLAMHLMNSVEKHRLCPSFEEAFLSEWSTVFHILITIY